MVKYFGKIHIPIAWTVFIQVLLCLPGSAIPGGFAFDIPHLDKIIHVIFYGVLVGLWCLYYRMKAGNYERLKLIFFWIFLIASVNGIAIEYIQFYFIPHRSFDKGDIIADLLSSGITYGVCNVKLLTGEWKNIPNK